jgi:hypothetical protein
MNVAVIVLKSLENVQAQLPIFAKRKVARQQTTSILFNVRSNHSQCSKVEYYIDNTPYQSVFFGGSTSESAFGLKKNSKIEYSSCQVCKIKGDKKKKSVMKILMHLWIKHKKRGSAN